MGRTVGELLGSITHQEWVEWQVFARTEPIGDTRADIRAAIIAHAVAQTVPRRRGTKGPALTAFVPDWWKSDEREPGQSDPAQMLRAAISITAQSGGEVPAYVEEALASVDGDREAHGSSGA